MVGGAGWQHGLGRRDRVVKHQIESNEGSTSAGSDGDKRQGRGRTMRPSITMLSVLIVVTNFVRDKIRRRAGGAPLGLQSR